MNEVQALIEAFDEAAANGERCALATIVSVQGSSYRKPGARMLVRESGSSTGTISAGCLENDVIEHAKRIIRSGKAELVEYDTTPTSDEMAWGLGLGCNGVVRVLVEPIGNDSLIIEGLRRSYQESDDAAPSIAATVYQTSQGFGHREDLELRTGARVLLGSDETCASEHLSHGEARAIANCLQGFSGGSEKFATETIDIGGVSAQVFAEKLLPPVRLVVFGAGPDAVPLVELARGLGWRTEVVDPMNRSATPDRFADADQVTLTQPEDVALNVRIQPGTMAVIMSHNYAHDLTFLSFLLESPAQYIGVMGPRKRTDRMLGELITENGDVLTTANLTRLHSPVGLDVGANSPFEISLSIVGEISAVLNRRTGGLLRERRAPIQGSTSEASAASRPGPADNASAPPTSLARDAN